MADITHLINGQNLGVPRDWQSLELTIDWLNRESDESGNETGAINVSDLSFTGRANAYLQRRIFNGLEGGVGIFEGEPYKILVGDPQNPKFTFDGYLDFTEEATILGGEEITCSLKRRKGADWLNDTADTFSFASLYVDGIITDSDFVRVPYVINYIPDGLQIVMLSISIYMMTKELIENVQALAESIADLVDAATPVVGVGVGFGAVAVTAWDLGNFILATLKTIARIAYIIAITVAIVNLIDAFFQQLLPARRFHLGMTFRKMFEKACEKLELTFQSSIQDLDLVYIPRKDRRGGERGERGYPVNSGPIYGFGDYIRVMKEVFNADYRINNGVFMFERRDAFESNSTYKPKNFFNNQERKLQQFKLNTDEMVANYNIFFALDAQDQNTLDNQEGRIFQAITEPVTKNNADLVNVKGLAQIDIPFSLGVDKKGLTTVEEIFKGLASVVDGLTGIFGGGTNYSARINNRIGSLLLSSHFLTFGKVVAMNGSKLAPNQRQVVNARKFWDQYHSINSAVENQFRIFENQPVPMTFEEFCILLENNRAQDEKGNQYIIERVSYLPYSGRANINYRVKQKYTNNLRVKIV